MEVNGTAGKPGGGTWTATSDANLKQNVEAFTDGLDILLQFQPKWYRYNGTFGLPSDSRYVGVIAQDVREIAPYMIDTVAMVDTTMNVTEDFLNYDGTALTYIIVNSIKELNERIANQDSLLQLVTNLGDEVNYLQEVVNSCCQSPGFRYGSDNPNETVTVNKALGEYVVLSTDPNPFSDNVKIAFDIPESSQNVEILISDGQGSLINRFIIDQRGAGSITFYGSEVRSGAYLCSLIINGRVVKTNKMIKN